MNIRVGYIPYLNMVPFHHGFGPEPMESGIRRFEFHPVSPRELGQRADNGTIDAGAVSLVDFIRCSSQYEPINSFGIGIKRTAQSVLLFSNRMMPFIQGTCAVTDETSTSFRLLQLLLEVRFGVKGVRYARLAPSMLLDGSVDAVLLIGDEALKAKKEGVPGLPFVTDLGEEWYVWQKTPFVFARWAMRSALHEDVKDALEFCIQKSLETHRLMMNQFAQEESVKLRLGPESIKMYWDNFAYTLTPEHHQAIATFSELLEKVPANV
jgi:predicted solute-binding protein